MIFAMAIRQSAAHARRTRLGGLLLAAALLGAACGSSDGDDDVLPDGFQQALAETSEFQARLLADGHLEFEEYEAAVFATYPCMLDGGLRVNEPRRVSGQRFEYSWVDDTERADVYDRCYGEHQSLVDLVWTYQTMPTEQHVQEARVALRDCFRERGIDVPDAPTSADFLALARGGVPGFSECRRQITAEYDLLEGFIG